MDVLTIGEALACFAPVTGPLADASLLNKSIGGAEFNTAVGLSRLGNSVAWCSRLGQDPLGDDILNHAALEGIDTSLVHRDSVLSTGVMLKDRASAHLSTTYYYRANSAASRLSRTDLDDATIGGARHVHATGISMWIGAAPRDLVFHSFRVAREAGVSVSFDPNFRAQLSSVEEMRASCLEVMPFVTTFLCNESEAVAITGMDDPKAAARAVAALGPATVIVKKGADGVTALIDSEILEQAAWPVTSPVDSVGAGDAFNAGWIHAQLHGIDAGLGLALASFVAANVVAHESDHGGFPDLAEVTRWLQHTEPQAVTDWTPVL